MRLLAVLFLLTISVFSLHAKSSKNKPEKLNVVFILADDLGWRDLSCQGSNYYQTPNIDKLARQGVRFTRAYAASAVCSPTRSSILTGMSPARTNITDWIPGGLFRPDDAKTEEPDWQKFIPIEITTLPEYFKQAGYRTVHIGKWHLGNKDNYSSPTDQGYETDIASLGKHPLGGGAPKTYFSPYGFPEQIENGPDGEYLPERLAKEAVNQIKRKDDRPLFLMLSHYVVHTPLQSKPELIEKWKKVPVDGGQNNPVYASMVESLDNSVGKVMQALRETGKMENTVIVFCSDNGGLEITGPYDGTDNDPLKGQKGQYHEGGIRIPLIVKWPGVTKAGTTVDEKVITTDMLPTLATLIDAELPEKLDGINFKPVFTGDPLPERDLFWHYPHYHIALGNVRPCSVIQSGDWKLIEYLEDGRLELHNLKDDPYELWDVGKEHPEVAEKLQIKLHQWWEEVDAQVPEKID